MPLCILEAVEGVLCLLGLLEVTRCALELLDVVFYVLVVLEVLRPCTDRTDTSEKRVKGDQFGG